MSKSTKSNKPAEARPPLLAKGCVAFDFDGVLHENPHYALSFSEVSTDLITGAHERGYAVAVMTCNDVGRVAAKLREMGLRCLADRNMVRGFWHDPEVVLVTNRKISADLYVDDKAFEYHYGEPAERVFRELAYRRGSRGCTLTNHWGEFGAAGVVPWMEFRGHLYVLMGQRSRHVQQPGTWGGFGGALESKDEDTWDCAQRELDEEVKGLVYSCTDWSDYYVHKCSGCGWTYTTYLAEVASDDPDEDTPAWIPEARVKDRRETDRLQWVRVDDVDTYELHPGFEKAWPDLRASLEAVVADYHAA